MKHIFLISFIALFSLSCNAQNTINSNELTINGVVVMGKNKSVLTASFGQPIKIEKSFSEMDNVDMYIYKYMGVIFYVKENLIDDFEITNNKYLFTKHNIKVGDNTEQLKKIYPLSYNQNSSYFLLHLINPSYKFLSIDFNENKIITEIRTGSY